MGGRRPDADSFSQAFGFNAIPGLTGLSGILIRNPLVRVDQIHHDQAAGLSDYEAIVESTVRRARPVVLTAVAAMLAFIPRPHSSFWGASLNPSGEKPGLRWPSSFRPSFEVRYGGQRSCPELSVPTRRLLHDFRDGADSGSVSKSTPSVRLMT